MRKEELETKQELIEYILEKDPSLKEEDLDTYSVTQLIIVKSGIEAKINHENQGKASKDEKV